VPERFPTEPPTSTRIDIAAYNDACKAFDSIIHHAVMRSDARDMLFIGAEDFRYICEVRSILTDAERLLLESKPAMCAFYLDHAVQRLDWILGVRKRSRATTVIRGLDQRVREQLEWVRNRVWSLSTAVSRGR
jgi:hypothetical protein